MPLLAGYRDCASIPIDRDTLSTAQTLGCHTSPQNSRNMILAGYNGTVAEWTTHIGNYPRGKCKERCPGGRRNPCHQDITRSHLIKLVGTRDHSRRASDMTRAGSDSFQHIALGLVGTRRHHTAPVNPQKAGSAFERQGHWRRESTFAHPGCAPLGDERMIVRWWLSGVQCCCGLLHFVQSQPEHVVPGVDHTRPGQAPPNLVQYPAQHRPAQTRISECILAQRGIALCAHYQAPEDPQAEATPPVEHSLCCLLACRRGPCLAFIGIWRLITQEELEGFQDRHRVIGEHGFGKIEIIDGMSETGQVISQAPPEFVPRPVLCLPSCCLLAIRCCELLTRHVLQRSGQFWLPAYPLRQVIKRFLGLHRRAVKAQHKR